MDNLVIGFIVGIVGNIFASYIYDRLRSQNSRTPPLILIAKPTTLPSKPKINSTGELDNRAMNRERARRLFALLLFFTSTFLIFLGALQLPIFLIIPEAHTLNLGQIKLIGLFTGAIVPISSVRNFMTIAAIVLYLPLLLFGDRLLVTIHQWYATFWEPTFESWLMLRFGALSFLSFLISGVVIYAITDLPILFALSLPFLALVAIIVYIIIAVGITWLMSVLEEELAKRDR
ncbi:MAG TPA: hypothetical protein VGD99_28930 [Anaerolineae bacterium]